MSDLSGLTNNYFSTANEGFITTLSASVDSSSDTVVPLNSVAGLTDGSIFTGIVDPGNAKERAFTGVVDTSGSQITSVVFTTGSNATHTTGSTVQDLVTGTSHSAMTKGITQEHNQDGTHSDITATTVTADEFITTGAAANSQGWSTGLGSVSTATGYNNGNRSFDIDTASDLTSVVSEGMRFKVDRGTTPPTQCADFERGSSQYASITDAAQTGLDITGDLTAETWLKLESYEATMVVLGKYTTTGNQRAYQVEVGGGTVAVRYSQDGASTARLVTAYQAIPLNRWVHIAVTVDVSASSAIIYIDGIAVPVATTGVALTSIFNSTSPFYLGANNVGETLDGKLADARVWSDIRTATEIKDNMFNYPSDTTNLVGHWKLNGDFTDSSSNGNNLTASGGVVATNADNPWNATEYGIITAVSASDITVWCPHGYGIPNETLSNPFYSTQDSPFGFPERAKRTYGEVAFRAQVGTATATTAATYIKVPYDKLDYDLNFDFDSDNNRFVAPYAGLYHFDVSVEAPDSGTPRCQIALYKNGVGDKVVFAGDMNTYRSMGGSVDIVLQAGDYIEVFFYTSLTGDQIEADAVGTYFAGRLERRTD